MNPAKNIGWVVGADGKPGFTWNPIVGCTKGCPYCYARRLAKRFKHRCERCYRFEPHLHKERWGEPARCRAPTGIFVCSMGELFDPGLDGGPDMVLWLLDGASRHRYYLLTKRPDRMVQHFNNHLTHVRHNWWIGTSVSTRAEADERIPQLLELRRHGEWPVLFVSVEPMLEPIEVNSEEWAYLKWVIIGGQTGPGAVKPKREWVDRLAEQCDTIGVSVFQKNNLGLEHPIRDWPSVEGE